MSGETLPLHRGTVNMDDLETVPPWFLRNITLIARIWGVITLIAIWGSAIWTLEEHYNTKPISDQKLFVCWYLVAIGVLMVFIEVIWVIDKSTCCRRDGCCCAIWKVCLWLDNWKRGILYIFISIPAFLEGLGIYLNLLCGFMLILLGCLYITKTFRHGGYTVIREIRNTHYVESKVTQPKVITMEVTTQTEDDLYYADLFNRMESQKASQVQPK